MKFRKDVWATPQTPYEMVQDHMGDLPSRYWITHTDSTEVLREKLDKLIGLVADLVHLLPEDIQVELAKTIWYEAVYE